MRTIRASLIEYFRYESNRQRSREIRLEISKKELAERLSIRRTSLSREFQKMKRDGLIDYRNRSVLLLDPDL